MTPRPTAPTNRICWAKTGGTRPRRQEHGEQVEGDRAEDHGSRADEGNPHQQARAADRLTPDLDGARADQGGEPAGEDEEQSRTGEDGAWTERVEQSPERWAGDGGALPKGGVPSDGHGSELPTRHEAGAPAFWPGGSREGARNPEQHHEPIYRARPRPLPVQASARRPAAAAALSAWQVATMRQRSNRSATWPVISASAMAGRKPASPTRPSASALWVRSWTSHPTSRDRLHLLGQPGRKQAHSGEQGEVAMAEDRQTRGGLLAGDAAHGRVPLGGIARRKVGSGCWQSRGVVLALAPLELASTEPEQ